MFTIGLLIVAEKSAILSVMRQRRGIALIVVLLLASVMAALAGAFVTLNRANFAMAGDVGEESLARATGDSAVNFACSRLTADPDWGVPAGSSGWTQTFDSGELKVWEREQGGIVSAVGVMNGGNSCFQIHFQAPNADVVDFAAIDVNSIRSNPTTPGSWTPATTLTPARWVSTNNFDAPAGTVLSQPKVGLRPVPARSANVQVLVFAGDTQRKFDTTLHRPSVISYGVLSQGELGVGLGGDPATGDTSGDWSVLSADPYVNEVAGRNGVHAPDVLNGSNGQTTNFTDGGKLKSGTNINLFTNLSVTPGSPPVVTTSGAGAVVGDGVNDVSEKNQLRAATQGQYLDHQQIPNVVATYAGGMGLSSVTVSLDAGTYRFIADNTVEQYDGFGNLVATHTGSIGTSGVELVNSEMRFPENREVVVTGNLNVDRAATYDKVPYVSLGQNASGVGAASVLKVNGDVNLSAAITGQGALVSQGNVSLQGKSAVSAPADLGVAVFAARDVTFAPVDSAASSSAPAQVLPGDWGSLNDAFLANSGISNLWDHPTKGLNGWDTLSSSERQKHIRLGGGGNKYIPGGLANVGGVGSAASAGLTERAQDLGLIAGGQDFTAIPELSAFTPNTVQDYVAASLFLESLATGSPDLTLLVPGPSLDPIVQGKVDARIEAMLDKLYEQKTGTFENFVGSSTANPVPPGGYEVINPRDAEFRGVVYSGGNIVANMGGYRFSVDGAVAAQGDVLMDGVKKLTSRYNPTYIERFTDVFDVASTESTQVKVVYQSEY